MLLEQELALKDLVYFQLLYGKRGFKAIKELTYRLMHKTRSCIIKVRGIVLKEKMCNKKFLEN
ncbi:MAG: hypothetical protein NC918_02185 [Candidatus Omnitrophica bacterium]|nr:hypothetical protein [Candidatus Omnitrophota bacterium]